ncbi:tripartite tricarboxylate transporter substrate binding protein [Vineibacter terrae]|uniref:Bug family tripartite tricarboxylate transporter substrate binding protein n=1 Tax=Vineibacter terrae TaxID=2586908 RepID=UPI002E37D4FE|nr:tripartite tricarboxylate transporter substrate binding protein [Vineibacter terrae]HEX2889192.1 tripartite tricarboxylate transporter substrate binding protein [Vineibacter terrae]
MITRRRLARIVAAVATAGAGAPMARATPAFPSRQVRIIAPFAPGAATDTCARTVAQRLGERWGQPVVVENRIGASGSIGAAAVARAEPDGHTLLLGTVGTNATNASLIPNMPYDTLNDFAPISLFAVVSMLVVVHPSQPIHSVADLVALARKAPGSLNCGTAGVGSSPHLAALLFESLGKVKFEHVAYAGVAPMIPDLLQNRVNISLGDASSFLPHVRSGALRAIGVTTATRFPGLPDVPTVAEAGIAGYEAAAWYGVLAPAKTPPDIVAQLNREIAAIARMPEVKQQLEPLAAVTVGNTPEEFTTFIRAEHARWGQLIRDSGVQVTRN